MSLSPTGVVNVRRCKVIEIERLRCRAIRIDNEMAKLLDPVVTAFKIGPLRQTGCCFHIDRAIIRLLVHVTYLVSGFGGLDRRDRH
jgi:hypothetical protein